MDENEDGDKVRRGRIGTAPHGTQGSLDVPLVKGEGPLKGFENGSEAFGFMF